MYYMYVVSTSKNYVCTKKLKTKNTCTINTTSSCLSYSLSQSHFHRGGEDVDPY